jgi:hypothetical protein
MIELKTELFLKRVAWQNRFIERYRGVAVEGKVGKFVGKRR